MPPPLAAAIYGFAPFQIEQGSPVLRSLFVWRRAAPTLGPHGEERPKVASRTMATSSDLAAILRDGSHQEGATFLRMRSESVEGRPRPPPLAGQLPGEGRANRYAAAAAAFLAATIWSAVRPVTSAMWSNLQV